MKSFLQSNKDMFKRLTMVEYKLLEHDAQFDNVLKKLEGPHIDKQKIFFNEEIYDALS